MNISFPYQDYGPLDIPDGYRTEVYNIKEFIAENNGMAVVQAALENPIGTGRLAELARKRGKILIVADDICRPTPVHEFVSLVIEELHQAGVPDKCIEFMMALGTHRSMTRQEMAQKLGHDIVEKYPVYNHNWQDPQSCAYMGDTDQGVPVWINKKVQQADLVIGLGTIMPIEVCGFTGGGKILIPGVCGKVTNSEMHWTRVGVPSHKIYGKRDNPIRESIDQLARAAGLHFIVNVILDSNQEIIGAVAGDMVEAHRKGAAMAKDAFGVSFESPYDIVIADGYPFDIEFWQVNKALDTAGIIVKKNGVIILVSPCYEGFSRTHGEILEYGYLPIKKIHELVASGKISHKVVAVHMMQVSAVAVEKAKVILVSTGISKTQAEQVGLLWEKTPQKALDKALQLVGGSPNIAVLKDAARMLPILKEEKT